MNLFKLSTKRFSSKKKLFIFDFDETIIPFNSDTYFYKILPGGNIPKSLKDQFKPGRWLDFMRKTFDFLEQNNVPPQKVKEALQEIPLNPGFPELLDYLKSKKENIDSIIISNANTLFLSWILEKNEISDVFRQIFTNKAFITDKKIHIVDYHTHKCDLCSNLSPNLCKQTVLVKYLEGKVYDRMFYAGDGLNDFCPTRIFRKSDVVFSREGYPLSKAIMQNLPKEEDRKTKYVFWKDGREILNEIKAF